MPPAEHQSLANIPFHFVGAGGGIYHFKIVFERSFTFGHCHLASTAHAEDGSIGKLPVAHGKHIVNQFVKGFAFANKQLKQQHCAVVSADAGSQILKIPEIKIYNVIRNDKALVKAVFKLYNRCQSGGMGNFCRIPGFVQCGSDPCKRAAVCPPFKIVQCLHQIIRLNRNFHSAYCPF